ncbi:hypothetical protein SCA6_013922 [Theobroma cacao]
MGFRKVLHFSCGIFRILAEESTMAFAALRNMWSLLTFDLIRRGIWCSNEILLSSCSVFSKLDDIGVGLG